MTALAELAKAEATAFTEWQRLKTRVLHAALPVAHLASLYADAIAHSPEVLQIITDFKALYDAEGAAGLAWTAASRALREAATGYLNEPTASTATDEGAIA